jgi:mannose-6-phosphate isomerase-like protein (cupin superfamily)
VTIGARPFCLIGIYYTTKDEWGVWISPPSAPSGIINKKAENNLKFEAMKGYINNIEQLTKDNDNFRKVLYTARYSQLVLMSLLPKEEIGEEVHGLDQFLRIESGTGKAVLDGIEHNIFDGSAVVVPAGTRHNIINTSPTESMKLYTVYSPPDHEDAITHKTKADAIAEDKPFNGKTTE